MTVLAGGAALAVCSVTELMYKSWIKAYKTSKENLIKYEVIDIDHTLCSL